MTSIAACVDALTAERLLTKEQGEGLLQQELFARQAGEQDPARAALEIARQSLKREKYLIALQAQTIARLQVEVASHAGGVAEGVKSVLARDPSQRAGYSNVAQRKEAVLRPITAAISDALNSMRLTRLGLHQDRPLIDNIVRELFGQSSGSADAARFAKQMADAMESMRERFNAAGGDIPKRADWGLPQHHDARRVQEAGLAAWKVFVAPRLNGQKMLGQNGLPMTPQELDAALDAAFTTISTHGLNKLVPGQVSGKKLANQHQDHRFLVFKDADSWLEYDRQFGGGNPFFTMMGHLEEMAGDIALMEILGPNPTHAMRVLRDTARKQGVEGIDLAMIDAIWDVVSGSGNGAATLKLSTIENLHAVRNWLTSMKLGSALLSSPTDLAFMGQTAAWNGLSVTRTMQTFLSQLNPLNAEDRLLAVRLGLTAEAWSGLALAANRFAEVTGTGLSARAADLTMRASGLTAWTDAGQKAIGLEFLTRMAELRSNKWADVPKENRALLEAVGFTAKDWDVLRRAPLETQGGLVRLDLPKLVQKTPDAQRAVNLAFEAIETLTGLAIPSPDARTRAIGALAGARGTLSREVVGSMLQFKSFPMAVILSHVYKGIHMGSVAGAGFYLGSLAIATTTMGALAMQLKEIAKGREPMPQDNLKFWVAAFFQGGGAGIFGDFVNAGVFGVNRFGGTLSETLAGPTVGAITDIARLTTGQLGQAIEGEDANILSDTAKFIGNYTPVIGSLWYTRLAYERFVVNQLQMAADPDARRKFRAAARRREKEYGNNYWFRQGELTPE